MNYTHLTQDERYQIYILSRADHKQNKIARLIKRYASGQNRRGKIPERRPISQRAASVEPRCRIGHWEGDTLISAGHQ